MSTLALFVQAHGQARIHEVTVADPVTMAELETALAAAGIPLTADTALFIDESEEPVSPAGFAAGSLAHGARLHLSRCRRVEVTVHFLERTLKQMFSPGARVRAVKAWAVKELGLDHKDAAEHVLQRCGTSDRPASDTPLHTLLDGPGCQLCFDLVPEKRVEG